MDLRQLLKKIQDGVSTVLTQPTHQTPLTQPIQQAVGDFVNTLNKDVFQPIGNTIGAGITRNLPSFQQQRQQTNNQFVQSQNNLLEKAKTVTDPAEKQRLLKLVGQINQTQQGVIQSPVFTPQYTPKQFVGASGKLAGLVAAGGASPAMLASTAGFTLPFAAIQAKQENKSIGQAYGESLANVLPYSGLASGVTNPILAKILPSSLASGVTGRLAQGGLGAAENVGLDIATGNPVSAANAALGFAGGALGKPFAGEKVTVKSNFRLDPNTYDELIKAETVLRDPAKYIDSVGYRPTPQAREQAIQTAIKDANEIVDRLASRFLPDKVLNKVAGDTNKTIKALVDLHAQNKLANVPGMGLVDNPKNVDPLIQEAQRYKSADEFVKAVQNKSNISQQGKLQQIPLNKIKGSDYPELDAALRNGRLSLNDARNILTDNGVDMANSKVSMPIEVVKNPDGTFSLQAGNHRVAQQLVNGEKTIFANVANEKGFSTKSQLTDIFNQSKNVSQSSLSGLQSKVPGMGFAEVKPQASSGNTPIMPKNTQLKAPESPAKIKTAGSPNIQPTKLDTSLNESILQPSKAVKERGVMRNIRTADVTSPELSQAIGDIKGKTRFYTPYSDKSSLADAESLIATSGIENATKEVLTGPYSKQNVATGEILVSKAMQEGRIDEATNILKNLSVKATQSGQANQAWSMWSRMTPDGMIAYATRETLNAQEKMGLATKFIRQTLGKSVDISLTKEDSIKIGELMGKANQATDEKTKMDFTKQALELINNKIPYGVSDFLDEFRYNNMLSNPKSHARNIYQNAWNAYITAPATLVAEGKPVQAAKYFKGTITETKSAAIEALKAFKGETQLTQPDIRQLNNSKLPGALTWPTRALEAQDKFFVTLMRNAAEGAGYSSTEAQKLADYYALHTNIGTKGQGFVSEKVFDTISKWLSNAPKPVRWVVPFVKTPINAVKLWVDYSPAGVLNLPGNDNKRQQLAKIALGSIATYVGAQLAGENKTTWAAPVDPTAKELFYASGRKPFSVQIGDKWVPMYAFGPFAFALALPAAVKNYQEDSKTALSDSGIQKVTNITGDLLNFVVGQTPLTGLSTFAKLAQGDIDYSVAGNVGFTASQLIPFDGLVNYIAKALDPIYRKTGGAVEQIKSGIPGLSQTLQPYTDPNGQPSMRLPVNNFLPYDIGQANNNGINGTTYNDAFQQRSQTLQDNALINKTKNDLESAQSGSQAVGNSFVYWDPTSSTVKTIKNADQYIIFQNKDGSYDKIDKNPNLNPPQLTGNDTFDKSLISGYKSDLTAREKDIYKLFDAGQITQEEAIAAVENLEALKNQFSISSAGKKLRGMALPNIASSRIPTFKVQNFIPAPTASNFNISAPPTFKVSGAIAAPQTINPTIKVNLPKVSFR